ncbi:DUF1501 domain-containing protein [Pyxidicoccus fallax]|uniref:DUF1501 domain-containing protein n=1 Tax=Pyxidicoccus fallax TaxID=394095 RepID=A0A848LKT1_9BACT|nr:DUF1501 domain-containing protein [Pyxidicoccus fallax]NMO18254.1 DUF1501 domain-containing protein [Pyxidicoccus fallax]NPC80000.1 DUF1501 domain-containing protein [Pyxidicoccus fallax]
MTFSRRSFLQGASSCLGFLAAAATMPRWLGEASAATLSGYAGYRAAVCVFLLGGNDGNNVLVPLTSTPFAQYRAARPIVGLEHASLLPINPVGLPARAYGLHPALTRLRALFEQGRAAVVCNVGPQVLPMLKADYTSGAVARPDSLFSHSDQQDAWASAIANPSTVTLPLALIGKVTGWGGRVADKLHGLNPGEYPEVLSFGGKPHFAAGAVRQPMMLPKSGTLAFRQTGDAHFNALQNAALSEVMAIDNNVTLEKSYGGVFTTAHAFATSRAAAREAAWNALPKARRDAIDALFVPPAKESSGWSLHTQLYQVLRDLLAGAMPTARGGLGLRRQVFSVGLGGFDTHEGQRGTQDALLAQLDFALAAFHQSVDLLRASGVFGATPPQATLFTMSEFGRTLVENSDRGTDHAWGNHCLVLGERVQGRRLYGAFPNLDLGDAVNNPDTVDARGRWIPSLTVDQYAYSLAHWLGLNTAAERDYVFPNIAGYVAAATARRLPSPMRSYRVGFMLPDA